MHAGIIHLGPLFAFLLTASVFGQANWTTTIQGTPDPALPFVAQRIWPDLPTTKPLELKNLPGRPGWMVYADHHESKESMSSQI